MSKREYYKGGVRVVIGGVPVRMPRQPGPAMLAAAREGQSGRGEFDKEKAATKYARAIMAQRGIAVPPAEAVMERVQLESVRREGRFVLLEKAVTFIPGKWNRSHRRYADHWETEGEAIRFEIPNWDFVPEAINLTVASVPVQLEAAL